MDNYFAKLNAINVNNKTEMKNGLTYLSWAWAWGEVKKLYPDTIYTIYENADGWNYHTDGRTAWVKTGVTVNGLEHIEYLPVMDYRNKSIPADAVTSFDVNKAIQRSLTKALARHGLGLYIYAGEDLPEGDSGEKPTTKADKKADNKADNQPSFADVGQKKIDDVQATALLELIRKKNSDVTKVCTAYNVESLLEMTTEQWNDCRKKLEKK